MKVRFSYLVNDSRSMKGGALYHEIARYYDLIYHDKDYSKEVEWIIKVIDENKTEQGKDLLDVGCGTGNHILHLKDRYSCTGMDLNESILNVAREKDPGIRFFADDMATFRSDQKYDIILSMFGTIGYCLTLENLKTTIVNFFDHLNDGGVLVFEPWFTFDEFTDGLPFLTTYDGEDIKIARATMSRKVGKTSVIDMQYLVTEKNRGVNHFKDVHTMGLFEEEDTLRIMEEAGFKSKHIVDIDDFRSGLYVGIKQ